VEEQTGSVVARDNMAVPFEEELTGRDVHIAVLLARHGVDVLLVGKKGIESAAAAVLEENGMKIVPRADLETTEDVARIL